MAFEYNLTYTRESTVVLPRQQAVYLSLEGGLVCWCVYRFAWQGVNILLS